MSINTVLVTGGAGFIGSNLIEYLIKKNYTVISLDNYDEFYNKHIKISNLKNISNSNSFTSIEGDIRNKELLSTIFKNNDIDCVIHLAAKAGVRPSILNPIDYYDVNVNGLLCLLEAMKDGKVNKLINASSSSVYGNNIKVPYSENDNIDFPISPYAASKKAGELLNHTYHHLNNFDVINLRFFTVFGPRQRPDLAIHKFFKNIYNGTPIDIYGDGSTSRDYTYIDDIVQGICNSINYLENGSNIYENINLGGNSPIKLGELIELIEKVTNKVFKKNYMPMQPGDVNKTYADIAKAKKLINYTPSTSIENGLINFKNWYEENKS